MKEVLVLLFSATVCALGQTADVLTYHNDNARTGQNLNETILTPANVNASQFGLLRVLPADGQVYAQPLYAAGLSIPGLGARNVVFVATEHDSVYAYDADSGGLLWHVSLIGSNETTSDNRGCDQITPEIGITATPVIDRQLGANGTMFVVAMSKNTSGQYFQRLHALDLATGADQLTAATISATYPGTGDNSSGGSVVFDPAQYKERAGLLLLNGIVYTAWASHCDIRPYTGWIMGYDEHTLAQTSVLNITPNGNEGSIWMSGAGLAADAGNNIYFLVGNGTLDTTLTADGFPINHDFGNAFMKLSTAGNRLTPADYFATYDTPAENSSDEDLGSGGALVLPDMTDAQGVTRQLAVGAGKDANIFLVDRSNMGKFNAANDNAIYQKLTGALSGGVWSMPAYFNGTLYYSSVGYPLKAFPFQVARLSSSSSQTPRSFGFPGTTPSISANGNANGIVWCLEYASPAVLHAYVANNLANELYNSNQAAQNRDHFGAGNKFTPPTIANGKVYAATASGVGVFGLLSGTSDTQPPSVPTNLTATVISSSQINLAWAASTDNVGVAGYQVYRNGSQVATAAGTAYADTNLAAATTFTYAVAAYDAAGNVSAASASVQATTLAAPSGLVAAYAFNEGSGTTVTDVSGNGNNGTVSGATWTSSGQYGGALVFNGTSSMVTIGNASSLQLAGAMTLEAWVNPSTVSSAWRDVIYKGNDNYYLEGTSRSSGVPAMGGTFSASPLYGTGALAVNAWAHLAATYDGATVRLYVNGTQVASRGQTGRIATSANPLQIGGDSIYGQYFAGAIDEVRVYNVALTAAQIQTDMNTPISAAQDTQPPSAPASLTATAVSGSQINLSWSASTDNVGVTGYLVEREDPGSTSFAQVGTSPSTTYSDAGLAAGMIYSYRVRATDAAGNLSGYSPVASAMTPAAPSGLVAAYAFDEGSGTTVTDVSGNGNNGTVSGATWTSSGQYGGALVFNGTSSMVTIGNASSLQLAGAMTLEAWVNPSTVSSAWRDVIYKGNDNYYLEGTSRSSGVPAMGGTFSASPLYGTGALAVNTWAHLAATYDGATVRLYVNGTQVASRGQTGSIATSANPLQIGGDSIYGQYFAGAIDEVRVYNVALTAAQIQTDMNTPISAAQDTQPPSAPASLTATAVSGSQINLSWSASTDNVGVTGYLVEREDPGSTSFAQVGTSPSTTYSDAGLAAGMIYSYRVRATDAAGNLSGYSPVASAMTPAAPSGLVAAYAFDEGSGTTVTDVSGNGNNGTVSGATWTSSGQYGGALVFNGTSSMVTIGNASSLQLAGAMTLEAWVNPSTVSSAWRDVIYKGNDNYYLEGTSRSSGVPAMGGTFSASPLYGTGALAVNAWAHLAATYDGATVRLYVNGTQVASRGQTGRIATSANPLQIGGDSIYGQYFAGAIDEVRVYNVALTAAQIQTDMNTPISAQAQVYRSANANSFGTNPLYEMGRRGSQEFSAGVNDEPQVYNQALSLAKAQPLYGLGTTQNTQLLAVTMSTVEPRLVAPSVQGGHITFTIVGESGHACMIEASADLTNWSEAETVVLSGGTGSFSEPLSASHRFYRAKVLP